MRLGLAIIAVAGSLIIGSPDVMAQGDIPPQVIQRFRALPMTVAELGRSDEHNGAPFVTYGAGKGAEPLIAVAMSDTGSAAGQTNMATIARNTASQANILKTMFEGEFALEGRPKAVTYFGDFLTEQGVKQIWIADYDGVRTTIVATIYRPEDRRRIFDAVRKDLLNGAAMIRPAATGVRK